MKKEKEKEIYWDWLKHANNIFVNRGNFFLIAESAFIAIIATRSFIALIYPAWIYFLTGLLITLIWLIVNIKHIYGTHKLIQNELKKFEDHPWTKTQKKRQKKWPWSNHLLLGIILPSIFLLFWLFTLLPFLY